MATVPYLDEVYQRVRETRAEAERVERVVEQRTTRRMRTTVASTLPPRSSGEAQEAEEPIPEAVPSLLPPPGRRGSVPPSAGRYSFIASRRGEPH